MRGDGATTMRQKAANFFQSRFAATPAAFVVAPVAMPFSTTSTTFPPCLAAIRQTSDPRKMAGTGKEMLYAEKALGDDATCRPSPFCTKFALGSGPE
jgi:hypothetical protein